jgi:hypothetical protein
MVSDATGPLPEHATRAGYEIETYGHFTGAHIAAGNHAGKAWPKVFAAQPARRLPMQFGYPDHHGKAHLIVTRKTP